MGGVGWGELMVEAVVVGLSGEWFEELFGALTGSSSVLVFLTIGA